MNRYRRIRNTIKILKQLVHVLWAIEKDLHVITGNTKISSEPKRFDVTVETENSRFNKLMSTDELISLIHKSGDTELITLKVFTN